MNTSSDAPAAFRSRFRQIHWLRWIALSAIVVVYLLLVFRLHPGNFFGLSQDDTLYFSSAKAIADGQGYVSPSIPGTPSVTKYPVLYPWILSWVWRSNPSFPSNLSSALALHLAFGVAYVIAAFVFLRRLPGISNTAALVLTAVCAVNPTVLFLSCNLMSDIPFGAVALSACIVAARANEKEAPTRITVFSGILSGLSILIRAMGVPIAAGLFVAIALRNGWRRAAVFAACVLPFSVALLWRSFFLTATLPPVAASSCSQSWQMTWLYYTSYAGFWRADVFSNDVFWQTVASNLRSIFVQPGMYFVKGTFIRPAILAVVLLIAVSVVAIRGLVRLADLSGWQPIHFALGFSILPMLIWDYSIMGRFMIPFLPLLCAAIWTELRQMVYKLWYTSGRQGGAERRIVAGFFCLSGAVLCWCIGVSWWGEIGAIARISESRAALLDEKRAAYAWLEQKTAPNSRILAYEDASVFLYTGRQSLRPVIFSAAGVYRPDVLNSELACIVSSAKPLSANYWLVSNDDFFAEWDPARSRAHEREEEIVRMIHPLFRSEHGGVRIYKLDADGEPAR